MITGLDQFKISTKALKSSNPNLVVHLKFKSPKIDLVGSTPKQRVKQLRRSLKAYYKKVKLDFPKSKPLGKGKLHYGAAVQLKYEKLKTLEAYDFMENISITKIKGIPKKKVKKNNEYYSVVTRLVIDVEGGKKGQFSNELRIVLVKAKSIKAAKQKAQKEIQAYEAPYLNAKGRLVHWRFKEIIDCYETVLGDSIDLKGQDWIEVYSKLFKNEKAMLKVLKAMKK